MAEEKVVTSSQPADERIETIRQLLESLTETDLFELADAAEAALAAVAAELAELREALEQIARADGISEPAWLIAQNALSRGATP